MKILLADPHPLVLSALQLILDHKSEVMVLGATGDIFELIRQLLLECPDLILMDPELLKPYLTLHQGDNQRLANIFNVFHLICPQVKIIVLSSHPEAEQIGLSSGADGYINKTDSPDLVWARIDNLYRKEQES